MKLIVTTHELHYGGKAHMKGEIFDAPEKHAQLLKLLKKAADAPAKPAKPMGEVNTMQAAPTASPAEEPEPPVVAATEVAPSAALLAAESVDDPAPEADSTAPTETASIRSRNYQRRDLTAED